MTMIATTKSETLSFAALTGGAASTGSRPETFQTAATSLIDRFLAPPPAAVDTYLTPVQQGGAARAGDRTGDASQAGAGDEGVVGGAIAAAVGAVVESAIGAVASAAAAAAAKSDHPISVGSTVTERADGTKVTTVTIDVDANFRVDGGTLPDGRTAATEARSIEQSIERDFTKTYRDANGNVTRYVTDVNMTVNRPVEAGREQFVLVDATDSRLSGGLGIAPGFEKGRTAYISDEAGARTAPHEFGHLAGLRHTAQVDEGCVTGPGIDIENLMSQTGCSPTSQQIERSQLQQIFNTPDFR